MTILRRVVLLGAACSGFAGGGLFAAAWGGGNPAASAPATASSLNQVAGPAVGGCAGSSTAVVATLVRLAPGRTARSTLGLNTAVTPALDSDPSLQVITSEPTAADIQRLSSVAGVAGVGYLRPQTSEVVWQSCDYKLADNAAAQAMGRAAAADMLKAGLLTQANLDNAGTTFMISDDPTDSRNLFLTITLSHPVAQPRGGLALSTLLEPYVAVVSKATGVVMSVSHAHWYDGQHS